MDSGLCCVLKLESQNPKTAGIDFKSNTRGIQNPQVGSFVDSGPQVGMAHRLIFPLSRWNMEYMRVLFNIPKATFYLLKGDYISVPTHHDCYGTW